MTNCTAGNTVIMEMGGCTPISYFLVRFTENCVTIGEFCFGVIMGPVSRCFYFRVVVKLIAGKGKRITLYHSNPNGAVRVQVEILELKRHFVPFLSTLQLVVFVMVGAVALPKVTLRTIPTH